VLSTSSVWASGSSGEEALAEKRKRLTGRLRVACAVGVEPPTHKIRTQDGKSHRADVESGQKNRQLYALEILH
jgi:hypothetical protein